MLNAVEDENQGRYNPITERRALRQLESLLLLLSETDYQTFSLMSESTQKSILSLAYDLSAKANIATH